MARRRISSRGSAAIRKALSRPRNYVCEALEDRTLFVVLTSTALAPAVFEFKGETSFERVVVTGNTTVELIGAHIDTMSGAFSLFPMQGQLNGADFNGGFPAQGGTGGGGGGGGSTPTFSDSIYAMYVTHSDFTSTIAVADIPDPTMPGPHPMQPFDSGVPFRVTKTGIAGGGPPIVVNGGVGGALLGARSVNPQNAQNQDQIPIIQVQVTPTNVAPGTFTTVPAPAVGDFVQAGLTVTPGNNLNQFMFGGAITGQVNIHGSVNLFYAGWLVTGETRGETDVGFVSHPQNFNVDGNIHDLVTPASIGSDGVFAATNAPQYVTGFDMHVGGIVGQINSQGSIIGNVDVTHSPAVAPPDGTPDAEVELREPPNSDTWSQGLFSNQGATALFNNDTFETPQFLGPTDSAHNIVVDGELDALPTVLDFIDYYAVPLLAGQSISVQLIDLLGITPTVGVPGNLDVGVFDPQGRLIATDYSKVDMTQTQGQPFQITADRPGTYRIAVTENTNPDFVATPATQILTTFPYELRVRNAGDLAIGGMFANANVLDNPNAAVFITPGANIPSFRAENGDFGSAYAHGDFISNFGLELVPGFVSTNPGSGNFNVTSFEVDNGNLRAVEGASLGFNGGGSVASGFAVNLPPTCIVPHGSVGYLHATDPAGVLGWNPLAFDSAAQTLTPEAAIEVGIGGDYQFIDAANAFFGDLVARGNIGSIRADNMASLNSSYLQVNAGNDPNHRGVIDLIDVTTNIGVNGSQGGPAIVTGPGGNVRYMHVGPFGQVFSDVAFGIGGPVATQYQPGETADITDDSGSVVHLTPVGTATTPATLTVMTYPIRGSGGAAIVKVISTGGIETSTTGPSGTAEIGTIELDGTGTPVTNNNTVQGGNRGNAGGGGGAGGGGPTQTRRHRRKAAFPLPGQPGGAPILNNGNGRFTTPTLPAPPSLPATAATAPLTVTIDGPDKTDIYEITGQPDPQIGDGSLVKNAGQVTALTNNTPGEIVNIHLNSLGPVVTNGPLALPAALATSCAVLGNVHNPLQEDTGNLGNPWDYPFLQPTQMIRVLQNIVSITATAVGNLYAGMISHAPSADFSTKDALPFIGTPPTPAGGSIIGVGVDGNIGPISAKLMAPVVAAGSIASFSTPGSGAANSGAVAGAGIFAVGVIGPVASSGDFEGSICSSGGLASEGGMLGLTVNGVLSQARITSFRRFDFEEARAFGFIQGGTQSPITLPVAEIAGLQARDGIIGTYVSGNHVGPVVAGPNGFGIFDSAFQQIGQGTLDSITASGYGIRATFISGGASIGSITARGNGTNIPTSDFAASVRQSEKGLIFDPNTGLPLSFLNDIDVYLGTITGTHALPGVTDTGVIEDSRFQGNRDVGSVSAWSIRGRNVNAGFVVVPDPDFTDIFSLATTTINIANRLGSITTTGPVRGLAITTGRSSKYKFGGDVAGLNMTVAGPIGNLTFDGSLLSDSFVTAQGPNGRIGSLTVHGSLQGGVRATQRINKVRIDGNLTGDIKASSLGTLSLGGGIGNGTLTIENNVNTIQTDGDFGVGPSSVLTINGSLNNLKVGRNFNGTLNVGSNLRNLNVNGSIVTGTAVNVGNTLTLIKVGGDFQAGATIKAHIIRKKIVKGQDLGTILTT